MPRGTKLYARLCGGVARPGARAFGRPRRDRRLPRPQRPVRPAIADFATDYADQNERGLRGIRRRGRVGPARGRSDGVAAASRTDLDRAVRVRRHWAWAHLGRASPHRSRRGLHAEPHEPGDKGDHMTDHRPRPSSGDARRPITPDESTHAFTGIGDRNQLNPMFARDGRGDRLPARSSSRRGIASRDRVPGRARRGDARRQRPAQPRDVRRHLDGPVRRRSSTPSPPTRT